MNIFGVVKITSQILISFTLQETICASVQLFVRLFFYQSRITPRENAGFFCIFGQHIQRKAIAKAFNKLKQTKM